MNTTKNITQEQINLLAKARQFAETGDVDGWEELYLDENSEGLVATASPLASFDGSQWAEASPVEKLVVDGYAVRHFNRVQASFGAKRVSFTVVDLGDVRLSIV